MDSNGNYLIPELTSMCPGNNIALEQIETTFHQDLNGDGVIGVPAATSPASAQLAGTPTTSTTFDGTTLTLNSPSAFTGQIIGFSGDGTLANSDQIDLRSLSYNAVHSSFDNSSGALALSDGQTTANLQFLGQYSLDSFHFANDGSGGTIVYAATNAAGAASQAAATNSTGTASSGAHDNFVFAPNFGQAIIANFVPASDTIEFSKAVLPNLTALVNATHDNAAGDAVITDGAHGTITVLHVTTAQLIAHQSDFHFV